MDKNGRTCFIFAHMNPDGDALGSAAAMALAMEQRGYDAYAFASGGLPDKLRFMERYADFVNAPPEGVTPDVCIAVDTSNAERLGDHRELFFSAPRTVNIDHHISNDRFAQENLVEDTAATGEIIYRLLPELGARLTKDMAECLYIAVCSDTGRFGYSNTTADTLRIAAELTAAGADTAELCTRMFDTKPMAALKLIARAIEGMELHCAGLAAYIATDYADIHETGADPSHCDEIINYARAVETAEIAVYQRQRGKDKYKISLRSKRWADVNSIAASFGGGGHIRAAGCTVEGTREQVKERVLEAVCEYLRANAPEMQE